MVIKCCDRPSKWQIVYDVGFKEIHEMILCDHHYNSDPVYKQFIISKNEVDDSMDLKITTVQSWSNVKNNTRSSIPSALRHEVFKNANYKCQECGNTKDNTILEIDHIRPVSQGGSNELDNLQCLCKECNMAKKNRNWKSGEKDD